MACSLSLCALKDALTQQRGAMNAQRLERHRAKRGQQAEDAESDDEPRGKVCGSTPVCNVSVFVFELKNPT